MRLFLATPCHRATSESISSIRHWTLDVVNGAELYGAQCEVVTECPWIDCARADLVARFVASPCDAMLWRDDDVFFSPDVVRRLIDWAPPLAIVPYRARKPPHAFTQKTNAAGEVLYAGMGATFVRREVITSMIARHPELIYLTGRPGDVDRQWRCALFHHSFIVEPNGDRHLAKEDEAFFIRARATGHRIEVLEDAETIHAGISSKLEAAAQ